MPLKLSKYRFVFIMSCGRSGTKSLSEYFGFEHERPEGFFPDVDKLEERLRSSGKRISGKVSCHYNRVLPKLQKRFPESLFVHNVRNGIDVVNSFRALKANIVPELYEGIPVKGLLDMDEFERACHYWAYWNQYLSERIHTRIRLEDYARLIPNRNYADDRKTRMSLYTKPWSLEEKETFNRICGDLNTKFGYETC